MKIAAHNIMPPRHSDQMLHRPSLGRVCLTAQKSYERTADVLIIRENPKDGPQNRANKILSQPALTIQEENKQLRTTLETVLRRIAIARHDMTNLADSISKVAEMAEKHHKSQHNAKTQEDLAIIHDNTSKLLDWIPRLLSKEVLLDIPPIVKQPFDFGNLVQKRIKATASANPLRPIRLKLTDNERFVVNGDSMRLDCVIENLLSNAEKYTSTKSLKSPFIIRVARDTESVYFSIQDYGIGISADALPHIFDMEYRDNSSFTQNIRGSGIGLYSVKDTIQQHGGKIWVESIKGKGTTCFFSIPIN